MTDCVQLTSTLNIGTNLRTKRAESSEGFMKPSVDLNTKQKLVQICCDGICNQVKDKYSVSTSTCVCLKRVTNETAQSCAENFKINDIQSTIHSSLETQISELESVIECSIAVQTSRPVECFIPMRGEAKFPKLAHKMEQIINYPFETNKIISDPIGVTVVDIVKNAACACSWSILVLVSLKNAVSVTSHYPIQLSFSVIGHLIGTALFRACGCVR